MAVPTALRIAGAHWAQMRAHVAAQAPQEACGLLAGANGASQHVFEITNELASPTHFSMAPREQLAALFEIEQRGWVLLAIYHSHPAGPPRPSRTDVAEARYPGVAHLIWSPAAGEWTCRAFLLDGGEVREIEIESK
jgi:proteasome lid subunit RPN8/RPN11